MPHRTFDIREEDDEAISSELAARLRKFNERLAGPLNTKPVLLTIRDDTGNLVAGLFGEFFWNSLWVDVLWVDERVRGQRFGSSLLKRAEVAAEARGCHTVCLSTFSFQAPEFYLKHGYKLIGELPGLPKGASRKWFAKQLSQNAV